jgi:hypothetical protein
MKKMHETRDLVLNRDQWVDLSKNIKPTMCLKTEVKLRDLSCLDELLFKVERFNSGSPFDNVAIMETIKNLQSGVFRSSSIAE